VRQRVGMVCRLVLAGLLRPKPRQNPPDRAPVPNGSSPGGGSYLCHASYCRRYRGAARSAADRTAVPARRVSAVRLISG
jgi:hypothetical protein